MNDRLRALVEQAEAELAQEVPRRGTATHCKRGHERSVWNTRRNNRGLVCKVCENEAARRKEQSR